MAPNPASRVHIDPFKLLQIRPKFVMCSAEYEETETNKSEICVFNPK